MELEIKQTRRDDRGWRLQLLLNNEAVSGLSVCDRKMRIGSASVLTGGIAGVWTDRKHRMKGYARRVMEASTELMVREGYDVALLYGIKDFYDKFGYITCMPEHLFTMDTRDAERVRGDLKVRSARKSDFPVIVRIYNRDNATRTASVIRASNWRRFPMGSMFGTDTVVKVFLDKRQRVVGYLAYDNDVERCRGSEIGGLSEGVYRNAIGCLARRAVTLRREEISFCLPVDHPFARYARDFGLKEASRYSRNSNAMGRIIELRSTMERVAPVLSERLPDNAAKGSFSLVTDVGRCRLAWGSGEVRVSYDSNRSGPAVRIRQDRFMQLLLGYKSASDLILAGHLRAPKKLHAFLESLFPLQQAHMWWTDRF